MRFDGAVTCGRLLQRLSNAPVSQAVNRLSDPREPQVGRSDARLQLLEVSLLVLKFVRNRLAFDHCTHDSTPMSTAPYCTLLSLHLQVAAQATRCASAVSPGRDQNFPQFLSRTLYASPGIQLGRLAMDQALERR